MSREDCFKKIREGDIVYLTCHSDMSIDYFLPGEIPNHIGIYSVVPNSCYEELVVRSRYTTAFTTFPLESVVRIKKKNK